MVASANSASLSEEQVPCQESDKPRCGEKAASCGHSELFAQATLLGPLHRIHFFCEEPSRFG